MSTVIPIHPLGATAVPILVATDGRPESASTLPMAARVAERLRGAPEVLDVIEPLATYGDVPLAASQAFDEERTLAARETVGRQLDALVGAKWPMRVVPGVAAPTIAAVAADTDAAVVVLGIGRHRAMDRLFGTETALHVLRAGDRPVLAVGPEADGTIRRAVVAVDFAPASARAAALACRLLAPRGTLSLVHVRNWDVDDEARVDDELRRLAVSLRRDAADGSRRDVTIGTATLIGDPALELLDYAERVGADLVAVGTSGAGFFERLVVGSVATDVLRRTSARLPRCSVLACPAGGAT